MWKEFKSRFLVLFLLLGGLYAWKHFSKNHFGDSCDAKDECSDENSICVMSDDTHGTCSTICNPFLAQSDCQTGYVCEAGDEIQGDKKIGGGYACMRDDGR